MLTDINNKIHDQILAGVSSAKYLGVYIDNKLQWDSHINSIKLRLSKGTSILAKISDPSFLKILPFSAHYGRFYGGGVVFTPPHVA